MVNMNETTREHGITEPSRWDEAVTPLVIANGYHHLEVDTDPGSNLPYIDAFDADGLVMRVQLSAAQAANMAVVLTGAGHG